VSGKQCEVVEELIEQIEDEKQRMKEAEDQWREEIKGDRSG
jgi:hypothetical protein